MTALSLYTIVFKTSQAILRNKKFMTGLTHVYYTLNNKNKIRDLL